MAFYHWLNCNGLNYQLVGRVTETTATYTSNRDNDRVLFTYSGSVITDPSGNVASTVSPGTTPLLIEAYMNFPQYLYATINGTAVTLVVIDDLIARDLRFVWLYHETLVGTTYMVYQPTLGTYQVFSMQLDQYELENYIADAYTTPQ